MWDRFNIRMAICSSISLALLWISMRYSTFYTVFSPLLDGKTYTDSYVNLSFSIYMVFILIICVACVLYFYQFVNSVFSSPRTPLFFGIGCVLGYLIIAIFTHVPNMSELLLGVGISLSALFVSLLFITWCVRLMREPATMAMVYFALTICVICTFMAAISAMPEIATTILVVVIPLISAGLYYLAPKPLDSSSINDDISSLKVMSWNYIVPVTILISIANIFNKLIAPATSALIASFSRITTDVVTVVLFIILLIYLKKQYLKETVLPRLFIVSALILMLGLMLIVVLPDNGSSFGGAMLMCSAYCFTFLLAAQLIWDHVKRGISPVILSAYFLVASIVIPLLISNSLTYQIASALQVRGTSYPITIAATLSFLIAVIVFIMLDAQHSKKDAENEIQEKLDPDMLAKEKIELIARDHGLSSRESEVLFLLYKGRSRKTISETLVIAPATTQGHISHIYQKIDIHKRDELIDFVDGYVKK